MLHLCPTCHRQFDEPGFCPFDGTALSPAAERQTQIDPDGDPAAWAGRDGLPTVSESQPPAAASVAASAAPQPPTVHIVGPVSDAPSLYELPKRTIPLTPQPPGTGELTATRTRQGPPPSSPPRARAASDGAKLVSRSASENPSAALDLYHSARGNEYDKLVGQTLDGRYYVEKKIGEGGMGVVFSARHAVIERPLAIKVLKREAMRDTGTIRRFVQEAKAASRIGHPNIVDVTDFGTTPDGMTYSVMEFVPGFTLGAMLRHHAPFPALRAIRITAQIARALGAAHDKGIVHRDLKPENVFLLDRDGRPDFVKIVDFGIAKVSPPPGQAAEPRLTRAGSVFGTPEYMAPEQAAGRGDTDGRVDIYALGVLLYEMICGQVPHRGDSMVRTLAMQMLDPVEPPSQVRPDLAIAPALEAVVMRALAKKREERFQTMAELLEALDGILPPVVGQSVTGSPVYTLAALPPGADPNVVASLPAMPIQSSDAAAPPAEPAPATRRIKDEPQFTSDDRPVSFEHLFTEENAKQSPAGPIGQRTNELLLAHRRRWPLLLLFGLIAGGAAGAIAVVLKTRSSVVASVGRDAGVPDDARAVVERAPDDAAPGPLDAADLIVIPELDAGRVVRPLPGHIDVDAGAAPETPNRRGTIVVQVLTKPEGANLYDDEHHYRGPGGAQLEEPVGKKLVIQCRQPGYKPGTIEIVFDGKTTAALCVLERIKICINNIKNPFDDCEIDPNAAPAAPAKP